jgi:hypothetical protein
MIIHTHVSFASKINNKSYERDTGRNSTEELIKGTINEAARIQFLTRFRNLRSQSTMTENTFLGFDYGHVINRIHY